MKPVLTLSASYTRKKVRMATTAFDIASRSISIPSYGDFILISHGS